MSSSGRVVSFTASWAKFRMRQRRSIDCAKSFEGLYSYTTIQKKYQHDLKTRGASASAADVTTSLESAARALDRELRELTKAARKYNGIKTWGNVRFVLGKDRVNKAIQRLEHAKTLFANALTLTCIELLALGLTNVETVMRKCFEDAGLQTDCPSQALAAKIDTQHRAVLVSHNDHQKALTSKLDNHQRDLLSNQVKHQQTLTTTQRTQVEILRRQDASKGVAARTQQQTSSILRTVTRASMRAVEDTSKNMVIIDDIAIDVKQLISLNDGSLFVNRSCRDISFLGERQDRIMAYVLPFQDDLDFAIDFLISQHHEIWIFDAELLRSELQHLVDSAAQEKALQHPDSTAKPFDQWHYPENIVGFLRNSPKNRKPRRSLHSYNGHEKSSMKQITQPRKHWKQSSRIYTIQTSSRPVNITMPRSRVAGEEPQNTAEVGISYTVTHNRSFVHVHAHFLRHLTYASEATRCAQLNVFTIFDADTFDNPYYLVETASLADFDNALRQDTISPFHIDKYGDNLFLSFAAINGRLDILDYLEGQGIGQTTLKHDSSILVGLHLISLHNINHIIEKVSGRAADPSAFILELALLASLLWFANGKILDEALNTCQKLLRNEGFHFPDSAWSYLSGPQALQNLIDLGSPIRYLSWISSAIYSLMWNTGGCKADFLAVVDMLSILIEHGDDIHGSNQDGLTLSMITRNYGCYDAWCEVLKRNSLRIEDVLEKEGNVWLMEADWKKVWIERGYEERRYLAGIGDN